MTIDRTNLNDPISPYIRRPEGYKPTEWNEILKPPTFGEWLKAPKTEEVQGNSKPQELRKQYSNLLKKEYPKGANVPQSFYDKTFAVSKDLGMRKGKQVHCDPEDLFAIMYNESKFDPQSVSKSGKYAGLIQMDKGTYETVFKKPRKYTYEQYKGLSRDKQLGVAQDYLKYRIRTAGKGLDKYIDKNGKIDGGALYVLVWRPGDFETKSGAEIAKKVNIKRNTIKTINEKLKNANKNLDKKA